MRSFTDAGRVNNVTLVNIGGQPLVIASDRNDLKRSKLALFRLDTTAGTLSRAGSIDSGAGEGYGVCALVPSAGQGFQIYAVIKDGTIRQYAVADALSAARVRAMGVATPGQGGEEIVGRWRFGAWASARVTGEVVARGDGRDLVADVEGLALVRRDADSGYLIASSQGDNAYTVYRLPDMSVAGRFRIAAGAVGATEETDGIELAPGDFGPDYPDGLFVAQDGVNPPNAQNFKLVSWADVKTALALE